MAEAVLASADDVFINCPFDDEFQPIFRAIGFTVQACRFRPRSALELDDGGQARIEKIIGLIAECRYGIHDLSRTQLDQASGLPRFNMPFELGLFLGAKRYGGKVHAPKRLMILDVERYRYQRFISDLAGMDVHEHGGQPANAVRETRNWLANVSRRRLPSAEDLERNHAAFLRDLPLLAGEHGFALDRIPYVDFEYIVANGLLTMSRAE